MLGRFVCPASRLGELPDVGRGVSAVVIWHNPRCSKSRQTLDLLNPESEDYVFDVITHRRPYKEPDPVHEAVARVRQLPFVRHDISRFRVEHF